MPSIHFSDEELEALHAVHTAAPRVNWDAYERARQRVIDAGNQHQMSRQQQNRDAETQDLA